MILALSWCTAWIGSAERSALAQMPETVAQLRFEEGLRLYEAGQYEGALEEFRTSLELVSSPNSRLYVARCLRQLGRMAEAVSQYHLTERAAADRAQLNLRYRQTRDAAAREREAISDLVGWITITVPSPPSDLRVTLNGREVPHQAFGLALPVDLGDVVVRAEAEGFRRVERNESFAGGERETIELNLSPQQGHGPRAAPLVQGNRRRQRLMAATYAFTGVSLAIGAAFTALAVLTRQQYQDLEHNCDGPCEPRFAEDIDRGRGLQLGANTTLGIAVASAVIAVVLAAITPWRDGPSHHERAERRMTSFDLPWFARW